MKGGVLPLPDPLLAFSHPLILFSPLCHGFGPACAPPPPPPPLEQLKTCVLSDLALPCPCAWASGKHDFLSQLAALHIAHAAMGPLASYDVMTWASSTSLADVATALGLGDGEEDDASGPDSHESGSGRSQSPPSASTLNLVARLRAIVAGPTPAAAFRAHVRGALDWAHACVEGRPLFTLLRSTEEAALKVPRGAAGGDPGALARILALAPSPLLFAFDVGSGAGSTAVRDGECLEEAVAVNRAADVLFRFLAARDARCDDGDSVFRLADLILRVRAVWDAASVPPKDVPMAQYRTRPNDVPAAALFSVHLLRRLARMRLVEACRVEGLGDLGERGSLVLCDCMRAIPLSLRSPALHILFPRFR